MRMPQEIELWYIIPSIRKELSIALRELNLTQRDIAKRLEITEAAISQYLKDKRAVKVNFNNKIMSEIKNSAKEIINGKNSVNEILKICDLIRSEKVLCEYHKLYDKDVPKNCEICLKYSYSIAK